MSEIKLENLTKGQRQAFDSVMHLIKNRSSSGKQRHICINGPAGTGKTTLTKFLIDHLVRTGTSGIMLAAPTHQAKKVLSELSGVDANTIHSILKINPTTYEDCTTFEQKEIPNLADCKVLFCDEASMYDVKLYKILMATIPSWCTVIALGDRAQIRPVEPGASEASVSPFFLNEAFLQVSLDEVMRSNAPIIEVATAIRNGEWIFPSTVDGQGVHDLTCEASIKAFMGKYFETVKTPEDLFETRLLAYTNNSVDKLNKIVRKRIYNTDEDFIKDEVIVMQEPYSKTMKFEGKSFTEIVFNNGEYVKVQSAEHTSDMLSIKGVSGSYMVRYWRLNVISIDTGEVGTLSVISDEDEANKLYMLLAKGAESFKSGQVKANWKDWWALKRKFHKVKALPCSTIHKSQGTSVDNVFLYTPCIHKADYELKQQLLYVGATRARHNVYYI